MYASHQAGKSQRLVIGGYIVGGVEAAQRVGLVELLPVHPAVLGVLDLICERRGERKTRKDGEREIGTYRL